MFWKSGQSGVLKKSSLKSSSYVLTNCTGSVVAKYPITDMFDDIVQEENWRQVSFARRLAVLAKWMGINIVQSNLKLPGEELHRPLSSDCYQVISCDCLKQTTQNDFEIRKCCRPTYSVLVSETETVSLSVSWPPTQVCTNKWLNRKSLVSALFCPSWTCVPADGTTWLARPPWSNELQNSDSCRLWRELCGKFF